MKPEILQNNHQVYKKLSRFVVEQFLTKSDYQENIEYGPLEINDFSICFGINVQGNSTPEGVYVKIPKADLYKKARREIMPLTDKDLKAAEEEYHSLIHLSKFWKADDIQVRFVEPLGFLNEYNAIVTSRVYADYIFRTFRRWDLMGKLQPGTHQDPMHNMLFRIGTALFRFHQTSIHDNVFRVDETLGTIKHYCAHLDTFKVSRAFLDNIIASVETLRGFKASTHLTKTLKGLDVRNILIDKAGNIFMLDPGRMKDDYKEADLARFLVTCRILYWGSILFFLQISPKRSYEESFLRGYYGSHERDEKILGVFIIKDLVKHWYLAHIALQLKQWPIFFKYFLKHTYINPFYKRQIAVEVANLEK